MMGSIARNALNNPHLVCRVMTEGEKGDLSTFGVAARQRVSLEVKCTVAQVRLDPYTLTLSTGWQVIGNTCPRRSCSEG